MNHIVTLLSIDRIKDINKDRTFVASVDGVSFKGTVKFIVTTIPFKNGSRNAYRIYFPKHLAINKHKDYKQIRTKLLKQMITKTEVMVSSNEVIR